MQLNRVILFLSLSPTDKLSAVCHHASKNRHTALGTGRMCCTISTADRFTSCAIVYIMFYTMCHCVTSCFTPCTIVLHHILHHVSLFYIMFYTMCLCLTSCFTPGAIVLHILHHVSQFYIMFTPCVIVLHSFIHCVPQCVYSAIGTTSKETPGQICCKKTKQKAHKNCEWNMPKGSQSSYTAWTVLEKWNKQLPRTDITTEIKSLHFSSALKPKMSLATFVWMLLFFSQTLKFSTTTKQNNWHKCINAHFNFCH